MQTILVIASGTFFLAGSFFLAYAVEFRADKQPRDGSDVQRAMDKMGGPALINRNNLRAGLILNCIGYVLMFLSTVL